MKKEDFKELQNNHWCAIAWETYQKKPNFRLVRRRLARIAKILDLPERRFDDKEVRKIMGVSERIASSLNKDYVIRKSGELILGDDAREMERLTLKQTAKMGFCIDCKKFVKRFKEWDEKKIPNVIITTNYECKECKLSFDVYKGMCCVWHLLK